MALDIIKIPSKGKCDKPQDVNINYGTTNEITEVILDTAEPVTSDNITFD